MRIERVSLPLERLHHGLVLRYRGTGFYDCAIAARASRRFGRVPLEIYSWSVPPKNRFKGNRSWIFHSKRKSNASVIHRDRP